KYINPSNEKIVNFANKIKDNLSSLDEIINRLFSFFDENIKYSRLNAPFTPLQRSDIDVLEMKCGTCGDYSNLIVSILTALGFDMMYAFVDIDCYGDSQSHICSAVKVNDEYKLIDATNPYRKFFRPFCPHIKYRLVSIDDFEKEKKEEEIYYLNKSLKDYGSKKLAGILYAPWIHDEVVIETKDKIESVFFLLMVEKDNWELYIYYISYTKDYGHIHFEILNSKDDLSIRISDRERIDIWDDDQFGKKYDLKEVPYVWIKEKVNKTIETINRFDKEIKKITQSLKKYKQNTASN
ncbi:hypothetical protein LJC17_03205, partial [Acholeplasma sp. OttesenSCG-928-E16]|nr:hypothetical protein [Acholeplasma sp. OttesenSCG-928-E16]